MPYLDLLLFFFLTNRRPPISTRTNPPLPSTTLFRSDRRVEHRPPGHQRKIARAFDQRIAPARHVDGAGETPFDPLVEPRLDKGLCEFLGKLAGDTRQFTPQKRRDHAAPIGSTHRTDVR